GTVEPRKNLETLLDAWVTMRDRPDLVVVGSWGWRYESIRDKMARLGPRLHHLESVDPDQLPAIYNLARVLAHPAWYEGFGLPPLEAMASGTPTVVADTSSLPEVVADAGMVVPAGDVDAWRKALERVIADTDLAAGMRHRVQDRQPEAFVQAGHDDRARVLVKQLERRLVDHAEDATVAGAAQSRGEGGIALGARDRKGHAVQTLHGLERGRLVLARLDATDPKHEISVQPQLGEPGGRCRMRRRRADPERHHPYPLRIDAVELNKVLTRRLGH